MKKDFNQNYPVVKHNHLIEARYKLTLYEQKLVLNVAMMIKPDDRDFHEYRISVKEFVELMNVKGKGYHIQVRQKSKTLLKKPLSIPLEDGNELYCNWFSHIKYLKGEGIVEFSFDPLLKPYLLQLQREFTEYKIQNVMQLRSGFSIRLYELLKQYLSIGERILELDELKSILGIEGKYKRFVDFKRYVLEPAHTELNKNTDIYFSYEPIKTGRKITAIRFIITPQFKEDPEIQAFIDSVKPRGINAKDAKKSINTHGIDGAVETRDKALSEIAAANAGKRDAIPNPTGYLRSFLLKGFGTKTKAERQAERERKERIEKNRQEKVETERKEAEEQGRLKHQRKIQEALISRLNDSEREELKTVAIDTLPNDRRNKDISIKNQMCRMVEDFVLMGVNEEAEN